jgi:hypothetical protein
MLVAFWLLLKTEHMGRPWNNESAEKWWACGRHVRQKELAPSAKVRAARRQRSCVRRSRHLPLSPCGADRNVKHFWKSTDCILPICRAHI